MLKSKKPGSFWLCKGDHHKELVLICDSLVRAKEHATNPLQVEYISKILASLETGDMRSYKESQVLWVQDQRPAVETVVGFVEPYRDPNGVRAEFEGIVGVVNKQETRLLSELIERADEVIASLPWVQHSANSKYDFETETMGHRDFTSVHTVAYCSTLIFPGVNLPNYNDIRQRTGFKNIMITNSIDGGPMAGDSRADHLQSHEADTFMINRAQTYYLWVVFHELFGHGTGKLLAETEAGVYNFDKDNAPLDPTTGKPIQTWYLPNQTWTGVFGDIATSVDECRAECVGAYLLSNRDLMAMCGFSETTQPTASDCPDFTL